MYQKVRVLTATKPYTAKEMADFTADRQRLDKYGTLFGGGMAGRHHRGQG